MLNFSLLDHFFESIHFDINSLAVYEKIYVLVSGGHDSTLLAEYISHHYPDTTEFVNCYNPYETNTTLDDFESRGLLIIRPEDQYNYAEILKNAFLKLNDAANLRANKKYQKKIFSCCRIIKHQAFLEDSLFKEPNTVIISGIKGGDGQQRRLFLQGLRYAKSTTNHMKVPTEPTFFYRHRGGQLYCYPLRDAMMREFPDAILKEIKKVHPQLQHSGCAICPVIVLFQDRIKHDDQNVRLHRSLDYLLQLIKKKEFIPNANLIRYVPQAKNHILF